MHHSTTQPLLRGDLDRSCLSSRPRRARARHRIHRRGRGVLILEAQPRERDGRTARPL